MTDEKLPQLGLMTDKQKAKIKEVFDCNPNAHMIELVGLSMIMLKGKGNPKLVEEYLKELNWAAFCKKIGSITK